MCFRSRFPALLLVLAVVAALPGADDVPNIIHYQGRLTQTGVEVIGTATVTATILDSAAVIKWSATYAGVPLNAGLFNLPLGDTSGGQPALPLALFRQAGLKLRLSVDTGSGPQVIAPDLALVSVAYAMHAQTALEADRVAANGNVGTAQLAAGAVTTGKLADASVTTPKLADGAVTAAKLGMPVWTRGGDALTSEGTLGSTTDQAVAIVANNRVAVRFTPATATEGGSVSSGEAEVTAGVVGAVVWGGDRNNSDVNGVEYSGNVIGANRVFDAYGTIGGGANNSVGLPNVSLIDCTYATVAGGRNNAASGSKSTVGGGSNNTASGGFSTVGGGAGNTTSESDSTVGGGVGNTASGTYSTVSGGDVNTASGTSSTVSGGSDNLAAGNGSFVAGTRAKNSDATHDGCFMFADQSTPNFTSIAANSFAIRCTGGARFVTAINATTGAPTAGVSLGTNGTSWTSLSDCRRKFGFQPLDLDQVMTQVRSLPVSSWHYDWETDQTTRHIGPMAQDFKHVFYPGRDDTTISTQEADGVHFAAIKGLVVENDRLHERLTAVESDNAALTQRLAALEAVVQRLADAGIVP